MLDVLTEAVYLLHISVTITYQLVAAVDLLQHILVIVVITSVLRGLAPAHSALPLDRLQFSAAFHSTSEVFIYGFTLIWHQLWARKNGDNVKNTKIENICACFGRVRRFFWPKMVAM